MIEKTKDSLSIVVNGMLKKYKSSLCIHMLKKSIIVDIFEEIKIVFFSFSGCFLSPNVVVRLCSNFKSQVGLAKVSSAVNIRSSNLKSHNAPTTAFGHTALRTAVTSSQN